MILVSRRSLLLISLGILALSVIFLSWVLQMPSSPIRKVPSDYRPALGVVSVNVLPAPKSAGGASFCSSLPLEFQQDCTASLQSDGETPPGFQDACALVPQELQDDCVRNAPLQ